MLQILSNLRKIPILIAFINFFVKVISFFFKIKITLGGQRPYQTLLVQWPYHSSIDQ